MTNKLLALLFASLTSTAAFAGEWISDNENGCKIWNPFPSGGESVHWNGKCPNGLGEGQGEVTWYVNGVLSERAVAKFKAGKIDGSGTWEFICGGPANNTIRKYEGDFQENIRNGFARTENCDGTIDIGWWEHNGFRYKCDSRDACQKIVERQRGEQSARFSADIERAGNRFPKFHIDFPKNETWRIAYTEHTDGSQIIEYVAGDENVESWSQLVTFMYTSLPKERFQTSVEAILAGIKNGCSSPQNQILTKSEYMLTHRWSGENCGGLPLQEEVARYEYADAGFVVIKYTYVKHKVRPDLEAWTRRVIEAKITH